MSPYIVTVSRHEQTGPSCSPEGCACEWETNELSRRAVATLDENGKPTVCCEACGSANLEFDGWDIDKRLDCGHWRYR